MRHIRRRGFTLVELLIVVGMVALLATILLPMVNKAYTVANRSAMASDLMVISQAIEAYKGDFGDYPQIYRPITDPGDSYILKLSGFYAAGNRCSSSLLLSFA